MLDKVLTGFGLVVLFLIGVGVAMPSPAVAEFVPLEDPSTPVRLVVPSVDLRADVVPITLPTDGVLDPPDDEKLVGWWKGSRRPGAATGQTVLTGHTVHTGGGVMDRLGKVGDGDRVVVVTDAARVVYEVTDVETLTKAELADQAEELFSQDRGDNRLVLITCTGWNGTEFLDNVVVHADQLGVRSKAAKAAQAAGRG